MDLPHPRAAAAAVVLALTAVACGSAPPKGGMTMPMGSAPMAGMAMPAAVDPAKPDPKVIHQPTPNMRALGIYQSFSDADIAFMTGMIPHHVQAVIMAGWAPSHGARPDVAILCERIVVGQRDEIASMQAWLRDHEQPVPDATSTRMKMAGMPDGMLMPGMLSEEEMAALDKARGPAFDRLFLIGMIKHHQGAIGMVTVLFGSYGAAQDDKIYKFASDVSADQEIEIARMEQMLALGGTER